MCVAALWATVYIINGHTTQNHHPLTLVWLPCSDWEIPLLPRLRGECHILTHDGLRKANLLTGANLPLSIHHCVLQYPRPARRFLCSFSTNIHCGSWSIDDSPGLKRWETFSPCSCSSLYIKSVCDICRSEGKNAFHGERCLLAHGNQMLEKSSLDLLSQLSWEEINNYVVQCHCLEKVSFLLFSSLSFSLTPFLPPSLPFLSLSRPFPSLPFFSLSSLLFSSSLSRTMILLFYFFDMKLLEF